MSQELHDWWIEHAEDEYGRTMPKADEYGGGDEAPAEDLVEIGRSLAKLMGDTVSRDDWWYIELGIMFYITGKVARWKAAVRAGKTVSDDTLFDLGVYAKMAQRNRQVGGWPNGGADR